MSDEPAPAPAGGDRLRQLRAFCHTARLESITRAAEHLSSSQPSVSQQVRSLERELAVALFDRRGPKLSLTAAGEKLYRRALPTVMAMDRLPDTFADLHWGNEAGDLTLACGQSTAAFVLPEYLRRLRAKHPGIRVRLRCGGGRQRTAWLRAFEVDVAFGAMDVAPDDLEFRPVPSASGRHTLITPEDHPLAGRKAVEMSDLAPWPAVLPPPGYRARTMMDMHTRLHGVQLRVAVEIGGWNLVKRYVEAGAGISVVPDQCLAEGDRVHRIPMDRFLPDIRYGVLLRRDDVRSLASRRFLDLLREDREGREAKERG